MNKTISILNITLIAFLLPVKVLAKEPLQLEYKSSPDPFAKSPTWKLKEKPLPSLSENKPFEIYTECASSYCTRYKPDTDFMEPRRIHRTERKRQWDEFSTDQDPNSEVSVGISGSF